MSKIAIKGNESGTATFTIEAPATNTDRTFELPDEAGKVLTTGNNDPAEVFKQANILGTVSESGGVPTGAIIERDSNANGEYVKYADGTMICVLPPNDISFTASTGHDATWTFPSTFSVKPAVSVSGAPRAGGGIPAGLTYVTFAHSTTDVRITARHSTSQLDNIREYSAIAVGRWY